MALITLPSTPEKGVAQSYSLNLTDLFALVSDSYYTTQANISKIIVLYSSSTGNQLENITFFPDGVSTTINSNALFVTQALNQFQVAFISIMDKQNGRYVVASSSIPSVASYNISFTPAPSGDAVFSPTLKSADLVLSNAGKTIAPTNGISAPIISWNYIDPYLSTASGKYAIQFQVSASTNNQTYIFATNSSSAPTSFYNGTGPGYTQPGFYLEEDDSTIRRTADFGVIYSNPGVNWAPGDKVTVAIDMDNKKLYVAINNIWAGSMNPSAGTGGVDITSLLLLPRLYFAGAVNTGNMTIIPVENMPTGYSEFPAPTPPPVGAIAWVNPNPGAYNIEADGGLTVGPNRGGGTYNNITADSQVFSGDFEIIYNIGTFNWDSVFGFRNIDNNTVTAAIGAPNDTNNLIVNDTNIGGFANLNNSELKLKRIGSVIYIYTNGTLIFSSESQPMYNVVGNVKPLASLGIYNNMTSSSAPGTLLSASC